MKTLTKLLITIEQIIMWALGIVIVLGVPDYLDLIEIPKIVYGIFTGILIGAIIFRIYLQLQIAKEEGKYSNK